MGNSSTSMVDTNTPYQQLVDYVHPLSQNQRKIRLIDGYIHPIEITIKKTISNDVKSILIIYLESLEDITSQTEIEMAKNAKDIKMVLLGPRGVGKTSTIYRYAEQMDVTNLDDIPIEDTFSKTTILDGNQYNLDILDPWAGDEYSALLHHFIREGEAFMLMYAVNDERSFKRVNEWYKKIVRSKDEDRYDIILVGNKDDVPESERQVSYEDGKIVADEWNVPFIEQSAKENRNIDEAWELLIKEWLKPKDHLFGPKEPTYKSPTCPWYMLCLMGCYFVCTCGMCCWSEDHCKCCNCCKY